MPLSRYIIFLTFKKCDWLQIDTEHPQNGPGKLGLKEKNVNIYDMYFRVNFAFLKVHCPIFQNLVFYCIWRIVTSKISI